MKKKNRLPLILALLLLLCLVALAGITVWLKWQTDLILDETDRALSILEEKNALINSVLDHPLYTAEDLQNMTLEELSLLFEGVTEESAPAGENLTEEGTGALPGLTDADRGENVSERISEVSKEHISERISSEELLSETVAESESDAYGDLPERDLPGFWSVRELKKVAGSKHKVIFVGDSRTVGMGGAEAKIDDDCIYIGESGEGYNWLIEHGIDLLDEAIRANPGVPVVFNFGVNDCDAIQAYIEVYHSIEVGYPDTDFYYMSVNPVTEESPHVPLADVLDFNKTLQAAYPDQYIDTCSWMLRGGFEDVDGVHYSQKQYRRIHDYAVLSIEKMKDQ